jgi:hypothetical protein
VGCRCCSGMTHGQCRRAIIMCEPCAVAAACIVYGSYGSPHATTIGLACLVIRHSHTKSQVGRD